MSKYFYFWEVVKWFKIRVLNEREARAWAWILLFFAMIVFMNAFLVWNFYPLKIFVTSFLIDFVIRVFVNPKYSPSLIIWRLVVSNQTPEYTWAAQKRFARALWLILASVMFYFSIILDKWFLPVMCVICLICLVLLFLETAFGICVWCKLYNLIKKDEAQLCPGGVCEIKKKEEIQKTNFVQIIIIVLFIIWIIGIHAMWVFASKDKWDINIEETWTTCNSTCLFK